MSHNTPKADGDSLLKLHAAFQSILSGVASFDRAEGVREYQFEGFSILTEDPPFEGEPAPRQ